MVSWQRKIRLYVWQGIMLLLRFLELGQVVNFESHLVTVMTGICLVWVELPTIWSPIRQLPLTEREREGGGECVCILYREVDCLPTLLERIADVTEIVICVTNHETNGQWSHQQGQVHPNPAAIFIIKTGKNHYTSLAYLPWLFVFVESSR